MKKMKQLLALVLSVVMIAASGQGLFSSELTQKVQAESSITSIIGTLRSKFPNGKYWNHLTNNYHNHNGPYQSCNDSRCNNPDGYTSTPCASHNSAAGVGVYDCNSFDGGIQCWGFANKVFYDIHGVYASGVSNRTDTANISVGDWIRLLNDSHSAVVIARNGDTLTVVECNLDVSGSQYNCYIRWDKTYSLSSVNYFKHSDAVSQNVTPGEASFKDFKYYYPSGSTITLQWEPTVNTTQYNIWLKQYDANQGQFVAIEWIRNAASGLTRTLPDGKYQLLLQSYNTNVWNSDHTDYIYTQSAVVFVVGDPILINETTSGVNKYELYDAPMTWIEAKAWCEAKGGHLVTITNSVEQGVIELLIAGADMNGVWIGATDTETEGTWKWVTGESFSYTHWENGEPNDDGDEDYCCVYPHSGTWNDRPNHPAVSEKSFGFICEYEHLTHSYELTSTIPATCTASGVKTYTCTVCGATKTETVPALEHSWGAWTKINDTQHQRVCSRDSSHKETANHSWDAGSVTTPATCTASGVKTYTCAVCGGTRTETLPALGHDWFAWTVTKPATATADGEEARTCPRCGKTETRVLPKTGGTPDQPGGPNTPDQPRSPGDVDLDGKVTASDARLALRRAVELDDHLTAVQLKNADVDGQPGVTASDARLILRAAVGLEDPKTWK